MSKLEKSLLTLGAVIFVIMLVGVVVGTLIGL